MEKIKGLDLFVPISRMGQNNTNTTDQQQYFWSNGVSIICFREPLNGDNALYVVWDVSISRGALLTNEAEQHTPLSSRNIIMKGFRIIHTWHDSIHCTWYNTQHSAAYTHIDREKKSYHQFDNYRFKQSSRHGKYFHMSTFSTKM